MSAHLVHSVAAALEQAKQQARSGDLPGAESLCEEILRHSPAHADAMLLRGVVELQSGRYAKAAASFRGLLREGADNAIGHALLGDALIELRQPEEALTAYEAALRQDPALVPALFGRANCHLDLHRPLEALAGYEAVLRWQPESAEALYNRGNACLALQRFADALESYDRTIRLCPSHAAAFNNRAAALRQLQRPVEALADLDRALELRPGDADAWCWRTGLLSSLARETEALDSIERALELKPDFAAALQLRADLQFSLGQPESAVQSLTRLLQLQPDFDFARGALLHTQLWCAQWRAALPAASRENVHRAVLAGERADQPFSFLAVADDPAAQLACARSYVAHRVAPAAPLWTGERYGHERIRVAYVSADFRAHAVSYLLAGVFERHDRRRFDTIAVSLRREESSAMGRRVKAAFGRFIDVSGRSEREVAGMLRSLEIDIAVDLTGYTDGLRPQIFSLRPAPVQVNYLGYPGTSGAPYMDYIIADEFVIPPELMQYYSEHPVYLPGCYQANDDRRAIEPCRLTRRDAGLPGDGFVFCCFNNSYKINPVMFDLWMRLLHRIAGSVLWLVSARPEVAANLRCEARERGVDPGRLVFAGRLPYEEHLQRLQLADIFLDTLPFNGGATVSDALWAGLPVLTCAGRAFAARMAGSLLKSAGIAELVTQGLTEYESMAAQLAQQPQLVSDLRRRLRENRRAAPLFDTDLFRCRLESAYVEMWRRCERGEAPASFAVGEAALRDV